MKPIESAAKVGDRATCLKNQKGSSRNIPGFEIQFIKSIEATGGYATQVVCGTSGAS